MKETNFISKYEEECFLLSNKIMLAVENTYQTIQQILYNCEADCTVIIAHFTVTGENEADLFLIQSSLLCYINHAFLMLTKYF